MPSGLPRQTRRRLWQIGFFTLFLLFLRFLPMIAISEVKGASPHADAHGGHGHDAGHGKENH